MGSSPTVSATISRYNYVVLNQYFAPLNPHNLLQFAFILLCFDALGTYLHHRLHLDSRLRPINWFIGLSLYVFLWFCLHFFLPFSFALSWLTLIGLSIYPLYWYFKGRHFLSYAASFLSFPYAFLAVLPLSKQFYYLLSKPPHRFDEMHYHFYSPARLHTETSWPFLHQDPPYLFDMIPRLLSTAYVLMFALTSTYSTAQALHFLLFLSLLTSIGLLLKPVLQLIPTILFTLSAVYFYPELLQNATEGYIDASLAGLILLTLVYVGYFVVKPGWKLLKTLLLLAGWLLGFKYTVFPVIFGLLSSLLLFTPRQAWPKLNRSRLYLSLIIPFLAGGFWYLKNLLLTGNPLYPFILPCWRGITCGASAAQSLQAFTLALNPTHLPEIVNQLTFNQPILFWLALCLFLLSLILSFFTPGKLQTILRVIGLTLAIEIVITALISGYQNRFFYHWNLLLSLFLILPLGYINFKKHPLSLLILLIYLPFITLFSSAFLKGFNAIRLPGFYTGEDILYAKGNLSLNQWITYRFPETAQVAEWCEQPPLKTLLIPDAATHHLQAPGLVYAYFTHCQTIYLPTAPLPDSAFSHPSQLLQYLQQTYPHAYIYSLKPATPSQNQAPNPSFTPKEQQLDTLTPALLREMISPFPYIYTFKP